MNIITKGFGVAQRIITRGYGTIGGIVTTTPQCRTLTLQYEDRTVIASCAE